MYSSKFQLLKSDFKHHLYGIANNPPTPIFFGQPVAYFGPIVRIFQAMQADPTDNLTAVFTGDGIHQIGSAPSAAMGAFDKIEGVLYRIWVWQSDQTMKIFIL